MVDKLETDERLEQLDREWRRKYEELQRQMEKMQHEMEEINELYRTEIRREAETFDRFVRLNKRTHELANMLWAAIKTIRDRDIRIGVMNEVRAGFGRLEAADNANKAKQKR